MTMTPTAFQAASRPDSLHLVLGAGPVLIALLGVAGCSDGAESADTAEAPVAASSPDSVPATNIAGRPLATTTTPPPPSAPTLATTAMTAVANSLPVTTAAPTDQTPEAAVQSAVGRAERTFLEVMRDPKRDVNDGLAAIQAATAPSSAARSSFGSTYSARRGSSLALVENAQVPFTITIEGEVFMIAADEALVQVCVIDSDVIVRIEPNAEGGDEEQRVVGDEIVTARRSTQRFVMNEGQWRLASNDVIAEYPGETACPAE